MTATETVGTLTSLGYTVDTSSEILKDKACVELTISKNGLELYRDYLTEESNQPHHRLNSLMETLLEHFLIASIQNSLEILEFESDSEESLVD